MYARESISAISLRRELRGTVFTKNYIDIYIANCHPVIALQLANS